MSNTAKPLRFLAGANACGDGTGAGCQGVTAGGWTGAAGADWAIAATDAPQFVQNWKPASTLFPHWVQ